ncbi:hypothetical protein Q7P37_003563 [Cladosporium fusiforme]
MPVPSDMKPRFRPLGLQGTYQDIQQDGHELRLEYPALDLLPAHKINTTHLRQPQHSGFNQKEPGHCEYPWKLCGTDFCARIPFRSSGPVALPLFQSSTFLTTVAALSYQPGRSLLQFVSTYEPHEGVQHRFRLLSEHQGQPQIVTESVFSDAAWEAESTTFQSEDWMQLVQNLLNRASDRAYLHVHQRLHLYRRYQEQIEQERWGWEGYLDAKATLAANLRVLIGKGRYIPAVEALDLDHSGEGTFLLPCGHEQDFWIQRLGSMSAADCINAACRICDAKIVSEADLWRLCRFRESYRRSQFYEAEGWWRIIEQRCPIGHERVSVRGGMLLKAMEDALNSLQTPESVSPKLLCMASSKIAEDVLAAFSGYVRDTTRMVTCSSAGLVENTLRDMEAAFDQVLGTTQSLQSLPPGWAAMVRQWATRAVQLASDPDYDGNNLSGRLPEVAEGEQMPEDGATMDELEAMLRSATLG